VADNLVAVAEALDLDRDEIVQLARNSFLASFLDEADKHRRLADVDAIAAQGS